MIGNRECTCDVLSSVESLESLLEETFRISEKILSRNSEETEAIDAWNESIEWENLNYLENLSILHKKFIIEDSIVNIT